MKLSEQADRLREFVRMAGSASRVEQLVLDLADENAALKRGIEHIRKQTTEMAIVQMCDILLAAEEQDDE